MGLLDGARDQTVKPVRERVYNASYIYGPGGGVTPSELEDIKQGDVDRETGRKRCVFCREAKSLTFGRQDCCSAYCEKQEHGWVPWGKSYSWDKERIGREWLTLG